MYCYIYFQNQFKDNWKIQGKLSTMSSEAIRAIKTVKSFANEGLEARMYDEKLKELYETSRKGFIVEPTLHMVDRVILKSV